MVIQSILPTQWWIFFLLGSVTWALIQLVYPLLEHLGNCHHYFDYAFDTQGTQICSSVQEHDYNFKRPEIKSGKFRNWDFRILHGKTLSILVWCWKTSSIQRLGTKDLATLSSIRFKQEAEIFIGYTPKLTTSRIITPTFRFLTRISV